MYKQVDKVEMVNKLHRRHTAKLLDALNEIKVPQIVIEAVKRQFSYYSNDIKEQVLTSNSSNHDQKTNFSR